MAAQWPPRKATAYNLRFPIYGGTLLPQTGVAGLDSEISKDGGAFTDCTNEATEIGTSGVYALALTATEMNADQIVVQVKTTSVGTVVAVLDTIALTALTTTIPLSADMSFSL